MLRPQISDAAPAIRNFRGNVCFSPRRYYIPTTEAEVCEILRRHAHDCIRVVGGLHTWSDITASDDIAIDLREMQAVEVLHFDRPRLARVGAGCRIKRLLEELARHGLTLPTVGAVKAQSIAGAIATGTHGSGKPSLSHFVHALRVAAYDEQGNVAIHDWEAGSEEFLAARCALGCMGVVLVVTMTCVPRFAVAQRITTPASLKEALEAESAHPLQELALMPHTWRIVAYQRREVDRSVPHLSVRKWLFRAYKSVGEDRVFHAFLKIAIRLGPSALRRLFTLTPGFVWFARALTRRNEAIDDNVRALTRRHDLFRHLEMEVLIPARHLSPALALIRDVITAFASDDPVSCENLALLQQAGLDRVLSHQRRLFPYFCHYPLAIRRIQRDDTLVSMASGQEPEWYSVSFFTYDTPKRTSFFAYYGFAQFMALALRRLFGGRPHWGKFFPLYHEDIAGLYEGLTSFRNICQRVDPVGVFQNAYTRRVLGFPDRSVPGANP